MNNIAVQKEDVKNRKPREFRKKCENCGTFSKAYRMFDIDGTNLVEYLVCLDCGSGSQDIPS